jgi:hypothetical protein
MRVETTYVVTVEHSEQKYAGKHTVRAVVDSGAMYFSAERFGVSKMFYVAFPQAIRQWFAEHGATVTDWYAR